MRSNGGGRVVEAKDHWRRALDRDLMTAALDPDEGRARGALGRVLAAPDLRGIDVHNRQGLVHMAQRFPDVEMGELRGAASRCRKFAWAFQQKSRAHVLPVVKSIEAAGVRAMLIKGAGLVGRYQAAGLVREMADWDVLVDATGPRIGAVHRAFDRQWDVPSLPVFREALTALHALNVCRDTVVQIDLHSDLVRYRARRGAASDLWAGAELDPGSGATVASREVAIFLAMINGSAVDYDRDVNASRWVFDCDLLLAGRSGEAGLDWDSVHREVVARDVVAIFARAATLFEKATGRVGAIPRVARSAAAAGDARQEAFHLARQFEPERWFPPGIGVGAKLRRFWNAFWLAEELRFGVGTRRWRRLARLPLFFVQYFQLDLRCRPVYRRRRRLKLRAQGLE
jgi:hypothetical protein